MQQAARRGDGGSKAHGQRQQRRAPTTLAGGLSQGLLGLYSGVSSGVTGIVSAPLQGFCACNQCSASCAKLLLTRILTQEVLDAVVGSPIGSS